MISTFKLVYKEVALVNMPMDIAVKPLKAPPMEKNQDIKPWKLQSWVKTFALLQNSNAFIALSFCLSFNRKYLHFISRNKEKGKHWYMMSRSMQKSYAYFLLQCVSGQAYHGFSRKFWLLWDFSNPREAIFCGFIRHWSLRFRV